MRWTIGILALAVIAMADRAVGGQPGCTSCNRGTTADSWSLRGWDAEACASPGGYSLTPGCCEDHRRCCDNAWAGYCDHRARVEAFWTRVGTPRSCYRAGPCRHLPLADSIPCEPCTSDAAQPMPADPTPAPADMPTPPAVPDKTGRNPYSFRLR